MSWNDSSVRFASVATIIFHVDRKYCNFGMDVTSSFRSIIDEMESKKNVHISIALSNVDRLITSKFIAIGADTINTGDNLMTCWFFVPCDFTSSRNCAITILLNFVATRFFSFLEFFDVQLDVVETFPRHVWDHSGGFGWRLRWSEISQSSRNSDNAIIWLIMCMRLRLRAVILSPCATDCDWFAGLFGIVI